MHFRNSIRRRGKNWLPTRWLVSFSLTAMVSCQRADLIDSIGVVEAGIFVLEPTSRSQEDQPGSTGGIVTIAPAQLVQSTRIIPCIKGVAFGCRYRFTTLGHGSTKTVAIRQVIRHPEFYDPIMKRRSSEAGGVLHQRPGSAFFAGYTLDFDFELVPGFWIMEIWQGDRVLDATVFELRYPSM